MSACMNSTQYSVEGKCLCLCFRRSKMNKLMLDLYFVCSKWDKDLSNKLSDNRWQILQEETIKSSFIYVELHFKLSTIKFGNLINYFVWYKVLDGSCVPRLESFSFTFLFRFRSSASSTGSRVEQRQKPIMINLITLSQPNLL